MKKVNKYFEFGLDLDISVFTKLKEGINKINTGNGLMIVLLNKGKISFQFDEKVIKESKEVIVEEEIFEKVEDTLSEDEYDEKKSEKNTSTNIENISFGSTNLSGIVEKNTYFTEDINEIEPIQATSLSNDDQEEIKEFN